jgi:curved DNA-binding protein CbpA
MARDDDLYAVLGVAPSATPEEIRHAYRALARLHHPDTRAEDPTSVVVAFGSEGDEAFQRVMDAYAVLGDPDARAVYDRGRRPRIRRPVEVRRREPRRPVGDDVQPAIRVGPVRWHRW